MAGIEAAPLQGATFGNGRKISRLIKFKNKTEFRDPAVKAIRLWCADGLRDASRKKTPRVT
jgi:hypothetical protein